MAEPDLTRGPRLRIVAINDVYVLDALPHLAGLVAHARATDPADTLLVTLAGDFVAPSLLSSLDAGAGMVDTLNAVGVTHACFGNHEDDIPPHELSARARELRATLLGTNLRGYDPDLPLSDVVEVRAPSGAVTKVGLVGVVMDDRAVYRRPPFAPATVLPANRAALDEARRLRASGCDTVVALTHQPVADDRALASAALGDLAFPVLLGGHDHQPYLETVADTTLVKAGADAILAAVVELAFPPSGKGRPKVSATLVKTRDYPEVAEVRARARSHEEKVHALASAVLLVIEPGVTLSSRGTRSRQTTLGELLATRVRDTLGADLCVFNGGGIRASRDYTETFSYGDLEAEVPFANELVVVALPGAVVERAIAVSRHKAPVESGSFFQVCDRTVVGPDGRLTHVAGAPFDPSRTYTVALVRNLFEGMDHVTPLVDFARERPDAIPPAGSGRDVKVVLLESFARHLWSKLGGFARVDRNSDGFVTPSELGAAITEHTRRPPSDVAAGIVMRALDGDRDARISASEAPPEPASDSSETVK